MAFCPHCGKPAGDQATKCVACGKEIAPAQVGARGGFKGTMMMMSPAAVTAKGPEAEPEPSKPAGAGPAVDAPPPSAAAAPPPAAGASEDEPTTGNRPSPLKATMVGGMGLVAPKPPAASPAAAPAKPAAEASTSSASAAADKVAAFAKTAPGSPLDLASSAETAQPAPKREPEPTPEPAAGPAGFLAGDPMGPPDGAPAAAPVQPPPERPRPMRQSFDLDYNPPQTKSWTWVVAGFVGMVVIAGAGLLAAKLMGLL